MRRAFPLLSLPLALLALLLAPLAPAQGGSDAPRMIADLYPGARTGVNGGSGECVSNGKTFFFVGEDDSERGVQIWACDGATRKLTQLTGSGACPERSDSLWIDANDQLYFFYRDPEHGSEVWSARGATPGSERMLVDASPGAADSSFYFFQTIGPRAIFALANSVTGKPALYVSDGSPEGTRLLQDQGRLWYDEVGMSNGLFYYLYYPPQASGFELWRSDGTASGTLALQGLGMAAQAGGCDEAASVGPATYLLVRASISAYPPQQDQLWRTDGSRRNTERISFPGHEEFTSSIHHLVAFQERLYFVALSAAGDYRLYRFDEKPDVPTTATEVARFPGSGLAEPFLYINASGRQIILAALHGLWRSDGTAQGTMLLRKMNPDFGVYGNRPDRPWANAAYPRFIRIPGQDRWIFSAAEPGSTACELWLTDGTPEGVTRLTAFEDAALEYGPTNLTLLGPNLFFLKSDPAHGHEPWLLPLTRLLCAARGWAAYR